VRAIPPLPRPSARNLPRNFSALENSCTKIRESYPTPPSPERYCTRPSRGRSWRRPRLRMEGRWSTWRSRHRDRESDLSSSDEEASHDWSVAQRVSPRRPAPGCEAKRTSNALPPGRWNRRAQGGHRRAFLHDGTGDVVMELRPLAHKLSGEHANS